MDLDIRAENAAARYYRRADRLHAEIYAHCAWCGQDTERTERFVNARHYCAACWQTLRLDGAAAQKASWREEWGQRRDAKNAPAVGREGETL